MKLLFFSIALLLLLAGCSAPQSTDRSVPRTADSPVLSTARPPEDQIPWTDRAIMRYISESQNEIMAAARKSSRDESWIIDRSETRDSTAYLVVHIGHDEAEPDGSDPRFATDGWLYLDTAGKRIFEYDLPSDSLVLWQ